MTDTARYTSRSRSQPASWRIGRSGLPTEGIAIEGRTKWPRGGESIYFRDPDGHLVELATPGLGRDISA